MSIQAIEKKKEKVKIISEKMLNSESNIIIQYTGLSVEEFTELRNQLREENVEISVLKNNISKRSVELAKFNELSDLFQGPTAIAFSQEMHYIQCYFQLCKHLLEILQLLQKWLEKIFLKK